EAKARLPRGAGRARDVYRHALHGGRFEPEAAGLSAEAARAYREAFRFELPRVISVREEETELGTTAKVILGLHDGYEIECVFIPMGRGRHTLCISSEVGCKMGCTFCETARLGLILKLTVAEILGQLLVARHELSWGFK